MTAVAAGGRRPSLRAAVLVVFVLALPACGSAGDEPLRPVGQQRRVSAMGPDGDPRFTADAPSVAHDARSGRYLVAWAGEDETGDSEIWGRLLDRGGRPVGGQFAISAMGGRGDVRAGAATPAVAADGDGAFLVVWRGNDASRGLATGEYEIFGQRVSAAGPEIGADDFRISAMGPDGDERFGAFVPDVAYNEARDEYLVVWRGDDDAHPLVDGEREIFARRVTGEGGPRGGAVRVSDAGPDGDVRFTADSPAVAANADADEYLVVWQADDAQPLSDDEFEIFAERLAGDGSAVGPNDVRVSSVGAPGDAARGARTPDVAYGAREREYLVVWWGEGDPGALVDEEFEIFGQYLSSAGEELGPNDFRISTTGPDGDARFSALVPTVADASRGYIVTWYGDTGRAPLEDNELEIYAARVPPSGADALDGIRVSRIGPDGEYLFAAVDPAVAWDGGRSYLAVWLADEPGPPLVDNEFEVFARSLNG